MSDYLRVSARELGDFCGMFLLLYISFLSFSSVSKLPLELLLTEALSWQVWLLLAGAFALNLPKVTVTLICETKQTAYIPCWGLHSRAILFSVCGEVSSCTNQPLVLRWNIGFMGFVGAIKEWCGLLNFTLCSGAFCWTKLLYLWLKDSFTLDY